MREIFPPLPWPISPEFATAPAKLPVSSDLLAGGEGFSLLIAAAALTVVIVRYSTRMRSGTCRVGTPDKIAARTLRIRIVESLSIASVPAQQNGRTPEVAFELGLGNAFGHFDASAPCS